MDGLRDLSAQATKLAKGKIKDIIALFNCKEQKMNKSQIIISIKFSRIYSIFGVFTIFVVIQFKSAL